MPDHPHCHSTALVFSPYTGRDIDSDDSHARPLIHVCAQPIVWFERERKLRAGHRADTLQTFSHFFQFFFVSFFHFFRSVMESEVFLVRICVNTQMRLSLSFLCQFPVL